MASGIRPKPRNSRVRTALSSSCVSPVPSFAAGGLCCARNAAAPSNIKAKPHVHRAGKTLNLIDFFMGTKLRCAAHIVGKGPVVDRTLYTKYIFKCQGESRKKRCSGSLIEPPLRCRCDRQPSWFGPPSYHPATGFQFHRRVLCCRDQSESGDHSGIGNFLH